MAVVNTVESLVLFQWVTVVIIKISMFLFQTNSVLLQIWLAVLFCKEDCPHHQVMMDLCSTSLLR